MQYVGVLSLGADTWLFRLYEELSNSQRRGFVVLFKFHAVSFFHSVLFSRPFFILSRQKVSAKSISVIIRSNNFAVDLIYVYEIMKIGNTSFPVG